MRSALLAGTECNATQPLKIPGSPGFFTTIQHSLHLQPDKKGAGVGCLDYLVCLWTGVSNPLDPNVGMSS